MDLVSVCKDKLANFRIKELKDVLTQLGLSKQGKKQDLMGRILVLLSDEQASKLHGWGKVNSIDKEGVAKLIDEAYRKMQAPGAPDVAPKSHSSSGLSSVKPKQEEGDGSYQLNKKVRCPCGNSLITGEWIKCVDAQCQVLQHMNCVIIPEKHMEGAQPEIPAQFYCEICRLNKADPFWVTVDHPLLPMKLTPSQPVTADGTDDVQNTGRSFHLTRADRDLLQKTGFDLQIWCILLNDKVPFRMQWPQNANLHVNGVPVRTTNRLGSQLLGINGRDDGPIITTCSREGTNKISLSRSDTRQFCFGIRIAKRRTVQQVLSLVPKEAEGEDFQDALARVCRCIGGGTAAENADSDSDLEVVADTVTVNLRCPMSGSRMKTAGRFKPCVHMGCFDLETFIEINQRSRKWQCPICLKNYSLENIIIDPYFNRITSLLQNCGEDVNEIDVKPDGSWRAKTEGENRDLGRWHFPDGSPCVVANAEVKHEPHVFYQVKQEGLFDEGTSPEFGAQNIPNGFWDISKPEATRPPFFEDHMPDKFANHTPKIMPMSSSATGSYRDGEDLSVNQEGGGHFSFITNSGHEFDSFALDFDPSTIVTERIPPGSKDADIIVLSDSEEDNVTLISPQTLVPTAPPDNTVIPLSATHPGVLNPYPVEPGTGTSATPSLGMFDNGNEFGMPLWSMPSCSQPAPGLQLFDSDADLSNVLVEDAQQNSLGCAPFNGYELTPEDFRDDSSHRGNLSSLHSNMEANGSLIDNPMAFGGNDPSLQIFLPSQPIAAPSQANLNKHAYINHDIETDDWISLRLGGTGPSHEASATANDVHSRHQSATEDGRTEAESLADTASLLLGMNGRTDKATSNTKRSDSFFSHPTQPRSATSNRPRSSSFFSHPTQWRSVRPRLYLSIDTDSD